MTNKLVVIINSLRVPKIKKILLYEMKFLVPNYSCLQNPWLRGYGPQIPVLSVLCPQLSLLNTPPFTQIHGIWLLWDRRQKFEPCLLLLVLCLLTAFRNYVSYEFQKCAGSNKLLVRIELTLQTGCYVTRGMSRPLCTDYCVWSAQPLTRHQVTVRLLSLPLVPQVPFMPAIWHVWRAIFV